MPRCNTCANRASATSAAAPLWDELHATGLFCFKITPTALRCLPYSPAFVFSWLNSLRGPIEGLESRSTTGEIRLAHKQRNGEPFMKAIRLLTLLTACLFAMAA